MLLVSGSPGIQFLPKSQSSPGRYLAKLLLDGGHSVVNLSSRPAPIASAPLSSKELQGAPAVGPRVGVGPVEDLGDETEDVFEENVGLFF